MSNGNTRIITSDDEKIFRLRKLILEAPEQHAADKLPQLYRLFRKRSCQTAVLAALTLIYKDILPMYKIRALTPQELAVQMKKEVYKNVAYESKLLENYRKFINLLIFVITRKNVANCRRQFRDPATISCATVCTAVRCACVMLKHAPLFNFGDELLELVIRCTAPAVFAVAAPRKTATSPAAIASPQHHHHHQQQQAVMSAATRKSLCVRAAATLRECVFEDSAGGGHVRVAVCKKIRQFARARKFRVRGGAVSLLLIDVLRHVDVREVQPDDSDATTKKMQKKREQMSRAQRKRNKIERQHEKDMLEGRATATREQYLKRNSEILNEIFHVYFSVLKASPPPKVLSSVLEGLAKFSKFINTHYFDDIFKLINELIESKSDLSARDRLNCIYTSVCILSSGHAAHIVDIDPARFFSHLYRFVLRVIRQARANTIASSPSVVASFQSSQSRERIRENWVVFVQCADVLIVRRRVQVSGVRVAAFVRRIITAALHHRHPEIMFLQLSAAIRYLRLFPAVAGLLFSAAHTHAHAADDDGAYNVGDNDCEGGRGGDGDYVIRKKRKRGVNGKSTATTTNKKNNRQDDATIGGDSVSRLLESNDCVLAEAAEMELREHNSSSGSGCATRSLPPPLSMTQELRLLAKSPFCDVTALAEVLLSTAESDVCEEAALTSSSGNQKQHQQQQQSLMRLGPDLEPLLRLAPLQLVLEVQLRFERQSEAASTQKQKAANQKKLKNKKQKQQNTEQDVEEKERRQKSDAHSAGESEMAEWESFVRSQMQAMMQHRNATGQ